MKSDVFCFQFSIIRARMLHRVRALYNLSATTSVMIHELDSLPTHRHFSLIFLSSVCCAISVSHYQEMLMFFTS